MRKVLYYVKAENPYMFKLLGNRQLILKQQKLPPRVAKQIKEGLEMQKAAANLWFDEDKFIQQGLKKGQKLGLVKGRKEGQKLGREEGQQAVVINLLDHMAPKQVAKAAKLPLAKVLKIQKKKKTL